MSDPRFAGVLAELQQMHDGKQQDYGRPADPFANVRASEDFGIPGWVGALVRGNDKIRRLMKAAAGGTLVNEGIEDSLKDLAVYAIIGLILFREVARPDWDESAQQAFDLVGGDDPWACHPDCACETGEVPPWPRKPLTVTERQPEGDGDVTLWPVIGSEIDPFGHLDYYDVEGVLTEGEYLALREALGHAPSRLELRRWLDLEGAA